LDRKSAGGGFKKRVEQMAKRLVSGQQTPHFVQQMAIIAVRPTGNWEWRTEG